MPCRATPEAVARTMAGSAVAFAEEPAGVRRHVAERRPFGRHHVRVELRRTADGLAGVVDDEVEAFTRGDEVAAERLDARRVAQVESDDLQPVPPLAEVRLSRRSAWPRCAGSAS